MDTNEYIYANRRGSGSDEVKQNEPFVGKAGQILANALKEEGFRKDQFSIINTVNCRPVTSSRSNGKPTTDQMKSCRKWIRKYITILNPEKAMALGAYAIGLVSGEETTLRVIARNTEAHNLYARDLKGFDMKVIYSIHPHIVYTIQKMERYY